ncbi:hypothetical protein [Jannaschia sp. R86511]|uniref:hypothetical protein n=1 Tax=Jannaschia sp. R86511 TaxID=3093853 RepID=UPI0036D39481
MVGVPDDRLARRRARRRRANLLNGSTAAGLWLARRHGVRLRPGPHGLWLAPGYPRRFPAPHAGAVCVGDVVLLRRGAPTGGGVDVMDRQPLLLDHESRHADQWARWGGPVGFLPAYLLASAWSWLRTGDPHSANAFEQAAGLADGGYRVRPLRGLPGRGLARRLGRRVRRRGGRGAQPL